MPWSAAHRQPLNPTRLNVTNLDSESLPRGAVFLWAPWRNLVAASRCQHLSDWKLLPWCWTFRALHMSQTRHASARLTASGPVAAREHISYVCLNNDQINRRKRTGSLTTCRQCSSDKETASRSWSIHFELLRKFVSKTSDVH